jgi:hypothetical protein
LLNVNQQTNVATITPGYVIKIPMRAPSSPNTIEHDPVIEGDR